MFDLSKLSVISKAIAAFLALLITLLAAIATGAADGTLDETEWTNILVALSALIAGVKAVYQVKNKPKS